MSRSFLFTDPLNVASEPTTKCTKTHHVAVIGAGAFGGWTALHLLRRGVRVTLLDTWGPGNSRASSGGESRIIRATYGRDSVYVNMVARALKLWEENQQRWGRQLYHQTGMLWMVGPNDEYEKASLPLFHQAGLTFQSLTTNQAKKRYPQINFEGVKWAIYEKSAGYLTARIACHAVLEGFLAEGGEYRQLSVRPGPIKGGEMHGLELSDGSLLTANHYVFACGPWLGRLFPDELGKLIRPTRQEVFFLGTPAGDNRFTEPHMPVWADNGPRLMYGVPGLNQRGFKVADDTRGTEFDPTSGERVVTAQGIKRVLDYVRFRFPALKGAPVIESRVCQYENSPDLHFLIDQHPHAGNVWLVGGGSGHGFKHGPALGEIVAGILAGKESPSPEFSFARFVKNGDLAP